MGMYKKSMLIEESDNVAVAVEPIQAGECTLVAGEEITANEYIKEGHKIARVDIEKGAEIIKYGVHIGVATQPIKKGACGEFPDRFERTRKGFITTGTHPNTFGVVLLSLGCQQTDPEDVAEEIRKTGRPVVNISIQADGGVTKAIQACPPIR